MAACLLGAGGTLEWGILALRAPGRRERVDPGLDLGHRETQVGHSP